MSLVDSNHLIKQLSFVLSHLQHSLLGRELVLLAGRSLLHGRLGGVALSTLGVVEDPLLDVLDLQVVPSLVANPLLALAIGKRASPGHFALLP